jgi:HNH endonuclease
MNQAEVVLLDLVKQGILEIDALGRIWRHFRISSTRQGEIRFHPIKRKRADWLSEANGYRYISCDMAGTTYQTSAHRLVWLFFQKDIPDDQEINHINGKRADNKPSNLEPLTHLENVQHAWRNGLAKPHPFPRRLTEKQVVEIRARYGSEETMALAREYGVNRSTIRRVAKGEIWKHLAETETA